MDAPPLYRRLASLVYEAILLVGVLAGGFLAPNILVGMTFNRLPPSGFLLAHFCLVLTAYFIWYWSHGGQTLAMQTWRLKLVSWDGSQPSMAQLWIRYLLAWPSVLSGAGLIWALFDRDRQFMHDRFAGTKIIST